MVTMLALDVTHPALIAIWHPLLNAKPISSYSKGSSHQAWWKCLEGHEWEARINSIAGGTGCPYCSGRRAISGVNDIATLYPHLIKDWHPDNKLSLDSLRPGSQEKGLWKCDKGHEWETKVRNRVNGAGCLVCCGKLVQKGHNDVATTHPLVATLWDNGNNIYTPFELTGQSEKSINFKCPQGHEWNQSVRRQTEVVSGCSYCAGRKAQTGDNDLLTTHPLLALEWHPTANGRLLPTMVTGSMDRKVWWLGKCGHEWDSALYSRTRKGKEQGCPVCSGRKALPGFNDLATLVPSVAVEWDYSLNGEVTPQMVTRGSNKHAYWKCPKGHQWKAKIADRTVNKSGCPNCAASAMTSKGEQEIVDFLKSKNVIVEQTNRAILGGMELDIFLPDFNFAIEYNGLYWHTEKMGKDKFYHHNKWQKCKSLGIQLVQVWEDEWMKNPEIIQNMILHKIGMSKEQKIYARKTNVIRLSNSKAREFLEKNHIQGFSSGSYYLGLVSEHETHAAIVLKKENTGYLNIIRYATAANVVGGFTKLISYAEKNLGASGFITFSDNCVSDGGLYANNGFTADKELLPDYKYVVGMNRIHKFNYRLKRFYNDPDLTWEKGLTERQLAELNGIERIWDAGKTRWIKPNI